MGVIILETEMFKFNF